LALKLKHAKPDNHLGNSAFYPSGVGKSSEHTPP